MHITYLLDNLQHVSRRSALALLVAHMARGASTHWGPVLRRWGPLGTRNYLYRRGQRGPCNEKKKDFYFGIAIKR